jgi:hypothetical protein
VRIEVTYRMLVEGVVGHVVGPFLMHGNKVTTIIITITITIKITITIRTEYVLQSHSIESITYTRKAERTSACGPMRVPSSTKNRGRAGPWAKCRCLIEQCWMPIR